MAHTIPIQYFTLDFSESGEWKGPRCRDTYWVTMSVAMSWVCETRGYRWDWRLHNKKKLRGVMESELCNSEKNVDGGENVVVKKTLGDNF